MSKSKLQAELDLFINADSDSYESIYELSKEEQESLITLLKENKGNIKFNESLRFLYFMSYQLKAISTKFFDLGIILSRREDITEEFKNNLASDYDGSSALYRISIENKDISEFVRQHKMSYNEAVSFRNEHSLKKGFINHYKELALTDVSFYFSSQESEEQQEIDIIG
jgi:hypothetical protein